MGEYVSQLGLFCFTPPNAISWNENESILRNAHNNPKKETVSMGYQVTWCLSCLLSEKHLTILERYPSGKEMGIHRLWSDSTITGNRCACIDDVIDNSWYAIVWCHADQFLSCSCLWWSITDQTSQKKKRESVQANEIKVRNGKHFPFRSFEILNNECQSWKTHKKKHMD